MRRPAALLVTIIAIGCQSNKTQPSQGDTAPPAASSPPRSGVAPARFSSPIAAAHSASGVTFVAGLVVPRGVIALTALGPDGTTRWTHDVITGVVWSANATLNVVPTKTAGAVVIWRGSRGGQDVTVARTVVADGTSAQEPFVVGSAACGTDHELAWIDHGAAGTWVVKTLPFGGSTPAVALTLSEDRDPAVFCGGARVFALGDGEDDVTLTSWAAGVASRSQRVVVDREFHGDDERGHELYSVGDALGIVRVGASGTIASREVSGEHLTPWRRLSRKLQEADDVTLVDADAHTAVLAFTHDASGAGDVTGVSSVEAVAWDRTGTHEASYSLAPADGTRVRGPFWSGAVKGGIAVAWVERSVRTGARDAPIVGITYRVVAMDSLGESHSIDRPADEVVDAGCDDVHCYAVALARAAGEDGGQPEVTEVLAYP